MDPYVPSPFESSSKGAPPPPPLTPQPLVARASYSTPSGKKLIDFSLECMSTGEGIMAVETARDDSNVILFKLQKQPQLEADASLHYPETVSSAGTSGGAKRKRGPTPGTNGGNKRAASAAPSVSINSGSDVLLAGLHVAFSKDALTAFEKVVELESSLLDMTTNHAQAITSLKETHDFNVTQLRQLHSSELTELSAKANHELSKTTESFHVQITDLQSKNVQLETRLEDVEKRVIPNYEAGLKDWEVRWTEVSRELEVEKQSVEALKANLQGHLDSITALEESVGVKEGLIEQEKQATAEAIEQLNLFKSRLMESEAEKSNLDTRVEELESVKAELEDRISARDSQITVLTDQAQTSSAQIGNLESLLVEKDSAFEELKRELDDSQTETTALKSNLASLESAVSEMETLISNLKTELQNIQTESVRSGDCIKGLVASQDDLKKSVLACADKVSSIQVDVGTAKDNSMNSGTIIEESKKVQTKLLDLLKDHTTKAQEPPAPSPSVSTRSPPISTKRGAKAAAEAAIAAAAQDQMQIDEADQHALMSAPSPNSSGKAKPSQKSASASITPVATAAVTSITPAVIGIPSAVSPAVPPTNQFRLRLLNNPQRSMSTNDLLIPPPNFSATPPVLLNNPQSLLQNPNILLQTPPQNPQHQLLAGFQMPSNPVLLQNSGLGPNLQNFMQQQHQMQLQQMQQFQQQQQQQQALLAQQPSIQSQPLQQQPSSQRLQRGSSQDQLSATNAKVSPPQNVLPTQQSLRNFGLSSPAATMSPQQQQQMQQQNQQQSAGQSSALVTATASSAPSSALASVAKKEPKGKRTRLAKETAGPGVGINSTPSASTVAASVTSNGTPHPNAAEIQQPPQVLTKMGQARPLQQHFQQMNGMIGTAPPQMESPADAGGTPPSSHTSMNLPQQSQANLHQNHIVVPPDGQKPQVQQNQQVLTKTGPIQPLQQQHFQLMNGMIGQQPQQIGSPADPGTPGGGHNMNSVQQQQQQQQQQSQQPQLIQANTPHQNHINGNNMVPFSQIAPVLQSQAMQNNFVILAGEANSKNGKSIQLGQPGPHTQQLQQQQHQNQQNTPQQQNQAQQPPQQQPQQQQLLQQQPQLQQQQPQLQQQHLQQRQQQHQQHQQHQQQLQQQQQLHQQSQLSNVHIGGTTQNITNTISTTPTNSSSTLTIAPESRIVSSQGNTSTTILPEAGDASLTPGNPFKPGTPTAGMLDSLDSCGLFGSDSGGLLDDLGFL
ncbi:hypothetical protein BDR26DRAFT_919372 [Obelidium mucronatum]|nr:hypothetical protein BDR26DRAFT_919372 [Obelidium mucronatum]